MIRLILSVLEKFSAFGLKKPVLFVLGDCDLFLNPDVSPNGFEEETSAAFRTGLMPNYRIISYEVANGRMKRATELSSKDLRRAEDARIVLAEIAELAIFE